MNSIEFNTFKKRHLQINQKKRNILKTVQNFEKFIESNLN